MFEGGPALSLQQELHFGIQYVDIPRVQKALDNGADVLEQFPITNYSPYRNLLPKYHHLATLPVFYVYGPLWHLDAVQVALLVGNLEIMKLILGAAKLKCSTQFCYLSRYLHIAILMDHPSSLDSTTSLITRRNNPAFNQPSNNSKMVQLLFDACECRKPDCCWFAKHITKALATVNDIHIARMYIDRILPRAGWIDGIDSSLIECTSQACTEMTEMYYLACGEQAEKLSETATAQVWMEILLAKNHTDREFFRATNIENIRNITILDWTPARHLLFPKSTRRAIETCLALRTVGWTDECKNPWSQMPNELLWIIFAYAFSPTKSEDASALACCYAMILDD